MGLRDIPRPQVEWEKDPGATVARRRDSKVKFLMYSHDSYGLGHLRRTLALAEAFVERDPDASVLILTGSTVADAFRMSRGVDIVKLPSAAKVANGLYEPSRMSIGFERLKRLRSSLILNVTRAFEPDVFVVDKAPLGMKREVYPTLEFLNDSRPSTLTVLGLRDVLDEPSRIREHWRNERIGEAIEELYDLVLVYGPREVYDPLPEYGLSATVLRRSFYAGYIGRQPAPETASDLPFQPGYVLVTVGGGGDGFHIVKTYLESLRAAESSFESIVVTGPLMDEEHKKQADRLSRGLPRVRVLEFRPDMELLIQAARVVVAMGGYNTTTELLAARKQTVIVPRVEPRVEQLIRATRLAGLGLVDMIHPDDLTPGLLRSKVEELMKRDAPTPEVLADIDLSGVARAVELVLAGVYGKGGLPDKRQLTNKRVADRRVLSLGA